MADMLAVEGFLGGGAEMLLVYPAEDVLDTLQLYLRGGARFYFFFFVKEVNGLEYTWSLKSGKAHPTEGDLVVRVIPRDYLDSRSGYAVFTAKELSYRVDHGRNTVESVIEENVFGQSSTDLTSFGDDLLLVWLHDDPTRTPVNRTEASFTYYDAGTDTWTAPSPVFDDGTADWHPQVATLPEGDAILVWENVKEVLDEPADPEGRLDVEAKYEEMKSKTEIAAAVYRATPGTWDVPVILTDNDVLDRSPRVDCAEGGTAMITWVRNSEHHDSGTSEEPNNLYYTVFDGAGFSTPALPAAGVQSVIESEMAFKGTEATLLMAADSDHQSDTLHDRELIAFRYAGGSWGPAQQIVLDADEETNPQLAYDANGNLLMFWYDDGRIMSDVDLDVSNAICVVDHGVSASTGLADFRLALGPDGRMGLVWQEYSEHHLDMWYAVHIPHAEPDKQGWTEDRAMTVDGDMEYAFAPLFDASGELVVAYNKGRVEYRSEAVELDGETILIENIPSIHHADLNVLWHANTGDLEVHAENITLDPPNPHPGDTATITAVVRNLGDRAASDFDVHFFDEGELIGTVTVLDQLLGGHEREVGLEWEVPPTVDPRDLSVSIDPAGNHDGDAANNTAVLLDVLKPDFGIESILVQRVGEEALLTIRVRNQGVLEIAGGTAHVTLRRDDPTGPVVAVVPVTETLVSGPFEDVHHQVNLAELPGNNTSTEICAVVDEGGLVDEFDETDNVHTVTVWH